MVARLSDWWLDRMPGDGFQAPETCAPVLIGLAYGHPRFADGSRVRTGEIQAIDGKMVTTGAERDVWELSDINPDYLRWLTEKGFTFDPEHPVNFKDNPRTDRGTLRQCAAPGCGLPVGHRGDHL